MAHFHLNYNDDNFSSVALRMEMRLAYDFAEVHVLDPKHPNEYVPRIHAAY